jgi:hypothetical protein
MTRPLPPTSPLYYNQETLIKNVKDKNIMLTGVKPVTAILQGFTAEKKLT